MRSYPIAEDNGTPISNMNEANVPLAKEGKEIMEEWQLVI